MATNDENMQGLKSELDKLKSAVLDFRNGETSLDRLKTAYAGITHNRELYESANFNMRSYTKIIGDAGNVINDAERGMAETRTGKHRIVAYGIAGALTIGAIGGYGIPKLFRPSEPETPAATRYEGDFAELEPKNARVSIRTGNGKSSLSLKGRQESGDFAAASRKTSGDTNIHIDTRGELSFNLSDAEDPNDMNFAFRGDRNGGHAVFNGTEKGDYKARIKNKGPVRCRNNLGR